MRLLTQAELRVKRSKYFKKSRTQPFVVSFIQALMAFKRLARRMKVKSVSLRRTFDPSDHKNNYLDHEIVRAHNTRLNSKFGAHVITQTNVRAPVLAEVRYRDADTGRIFEDEEEAREAEKRNLVALKKPFIAKAKKERVTLFKRVNNRLENAKNEAALGSTNFAIKRLRRKLKKEEDQRTAELHLSLAEHHDPKARHGHKKHGHHKHVTHAHSGAAGPDAGSGGAGEGDKPLAIGGEDVTGDTEMIERYIDYIPGTEIYYGHAISLQAKHGGYLSFYNKDGMTATAHKTLPTSRFVILKSSDLTNKNPVRYGDAVWMQASGSEVLGACFTGNISAGQGRKLLPTMIKTNRRNMFRAQQYGRWILVNKDDPVGTRGQVVKHHHNIMVEQEWYYLASSTPEDAHMQKIQQDIDDAIKDEGHLPMELRKKVNYFQTGDECVWKVHLVGIASSDGSGESKRAMLLSDATEQITESKKGRREAAQQLLCSLNSVLPDELRPESLKDNKLHHKQSTFLEQKRLIDRFTRMSAKGFTQQPSIKFIADLYGKDSPIYQKKQEVHKLRAAQIGIEEPPVTWVDIPTQKRTEVSESHYWDSAQALLLPTQTWHEMGTAMNKYYMVDYCRKLNAILILQKCVRRRIRSRYTLAKEFAKRDRAANVKVHKNRLHQQTQLMLSGGAFDEEETITRATDSPTKEGGGFGETKSDFFLTEGSITDAACATASSLPEKGEGDTATIDGDITLDQYMLGAQEHPGGGAEQADDEKKKRDNNGAVMRGASAGLLAQHDGMNSPIGWDDSRRTNTAPNQSPMTRKEMRQIQKEEEMVKKREYARNRMAYSAANNVGLPDKVFDDFVDAPGISVGVKYLRTLTSRHSDMYSSISVVKRPQTSTYSPRKSYSRGGATTGTGINKGQNTTSQHGRPSTTNNVLSQSMGALPSYGQQQVSSTTGTGTGIGTEKEQVEKKPQIISMRNPRPQTSGAIVAAVRPSRSSMRRPSSTVRGRR
jgi:hypothetical protein